VVLPEGSDVPPDVPVEPIVDGHSTHSAVRPRSANRASNAARRRAYGQPVRSSARWTRSKATKCAGHSRAA
jgi:hypothetical protein